MRYQETKRVCANCRKQFTVEFYFVKHATPFTRLSSMDIVYGLYGQDRHW